MSTTNARSNQTQQQDQGPPQLGISTLHPSDVDTVMSDVSPLLSGIRRGMRASCNLYAALGCGAILVAVGAIAYGRPTIEYLQHKAKDKLSPAFWRGGGP